VLSTASVFGWVVWGWCVAVIFRLSIWMWWEAGVVVLFEWDGVMEFWFVWVAVGVGGGAFFSWMARTGSFAWSFNRSRWGVVCGVV